MNYLTATTLRNAIATAAPQLHAQVLFDPTHGPCVAIVPPHNLTLAPDTPHREPACLIPRADRHV